MTLDWPYGSFSNHFSPMSPKLKENTLHIKVILEHHHLTKMADVQPQIWLPIVHGTSDDWSSPLEVPFLQSREQMGFGTSRGVAPSGWTSKSLPQTWPEWWSLQRLLLWRSALLTNPHLLDFVWCWRFDKGPCRRHIGSMVPFAYSMLSSCYHFDFQTWCSKIRPVFLLGISEVWLLIELTSPQITLRQL